MISPKSFGTEVLSINLLLEMKISENMKIDCKFSWSSREYFQASKEPKSDSLFKMTEVRTNVFFENHLY